MASHVVSVRLDDDEYAKLTENVERLGVSRASYIRFLISLDFPMFVGDGDVLSPDDLEGTLVVPFIDRGDVKAIGLELSRQGNNINQATKALNSLARLASQDKALRIDWQSFCGISERALESANESLKKCTEMFDRICEWSRFDCRNKKGRR